MLRRISFLDKSRNMLFRDLYQYFLITHSGLFDTNYYLLNNPDVCQRDVNPLWHFIKVGWKEGRNPSEKFNTALYLYINPDVESAYINPLVHYIKHGIKEGRKLETPSSVSHDNDYFDLSSSKIRNQFNQHYSIFPPKTEDIIIFPIIDWDFRFQRPQQLARQFALFGHRVFYLKAGEHYRENKSPFVKEIQENLFSVHLVGGKQHIPFTSTLTENNVCDLETSLGILVESFKIKSAIIKIDLPFWQKLTFRLRDSYGWKLVYDCMDLHKGFSTSNKYKIQDEENLLRKSNIILASSNYIFNIVKQYNPHSFLVPNAADYEFFHRAANQIDIEEITEIPHPIIGYYGAISDWFDTELVGELALGNPDWNFILIGDTTMANLDPISSQKNIHLLGEKPYADLPSFLSNFDVCIIPFKKIPLTEATNPVKLFEYLSAGKPVVATKLDELSNYEEFTILAETKKQWESAIKECLYENKTKELINRRYAFAEKNTWEQRAKNILDYISTH